jgi:RND family efflux transporter MFP subunit
MESTPDTTPPFIRKILRLVWKCIPFFVVILVILFVVLPLYSRIESKKQALADIQSREKGEQKPLTNVVTLELVPAMIMEKISLPGVTKPWISLEVVSEIKGKIITKKAVEGRQVDKGDVLAVIDKSDYQNAYDSALASYESALATRKRLEALARNNFVTQSQLDDAVARVKTTKAAFDNAELNLSRCMILSPMKGIIDRVHIETGSFLNTGDPVVQILQMDKLKVEVGIPESDVDAVRNLKTFDMTIDALGGQTLSGEYHYLYKTADAMARLYTLEIRLDNVDGRILPDMFARVTIIKQQDPQGIAVPIYSLVNFNKEIGVYVEKEGVVRFRPVVPGFLDGWKVRIPTGLNPGERVVVVGHRIVEDGEPVNVTKVVQAMGEISQ